MRTKEKKELVLITKSIDSNWKDGVNELKPCNI